MSVADRTRWTPEKVATAFDVSHETMQRLQVFADLLVKWQASVNLVGPGTVGDIWGRHIADSLQLTRIAPDRARVWVDLGSGAGLPGLPVAIMLSDRPGLAVHLVESNSKKCAFLRVAASATGAPVVVHQARIEALAVSPDRPRADVVTARALAPLKRLIGLATPFMWKNTICLFPKGQDLEGELTEASTYWNINAVRHPSVIEGTGTVLAIEGVTGVEKG